MPISTSAPRQQHPLTKGIRTVATRYFSKLPRASPLVRGSRPTHLHVHPVYTLSDVLEDGLVAHEEVPVPDTVLGPVGLRRGGGQGQGHARGGGAERRPREKRKDDGKRFSPKG